LNERVLILRHGTGASTRGRAYAQERWPAAKIHVHDLQRHGKPPENFRWDLISVVLIDDHYCRKEGLLWISELRAKPGFPRLERFPSAGPPQSIKGNQSPLEAGENSLSAAPHREAERLQEAERLLNAATITEFRPVAVLGKGATATVCLCERVSNGEQVVLKILKAAGSTDMELLPRFVQEYIAASRMNSPQVARVFEHGFTETHAYIVMEYFPEGDLRSRLLRAPMSEEEAVMITASVLDALIIVHQAGIVHRDLKPGNIMFRADGTLSLTDFGSARNDDEPVMETMAGVVIGTPYYLSPEQAFGGEADSRSDLYSVGALFFELLTREKMFSAGSVADLLEMHRSRPAPKLPLQLKRYQPFFEQLAAKKPAERYQTAADALDALMGLAADDRSQVA
jgi:serine/threonine protein kinase